MTLKDFIKRVDLDKDIDKMLIWSDRIGWSNIEIEIGGNDIRILPCQNNSPFSSDR